MKVKDKVKIKAEKASPEVNRKVLAEATMVMDLTKKHTMKMARLFATAIRSYKEMKEMDDWNFKEYMASLVQILFAEGYKQGVEDTLKGGEQ